MLRLASLATLVVLAASCGGSKSGSPATTTTTSSTPTTISRADAVNDPHPRVTARAALTRCRAAFAEIRFAAVAKSGLDGARQTLAATRAACSGAATLKILAEVDPNDAALAQAAAAEAALADAAVNYGHYLDHVTSATNGKKIFAYSVEEARQARILLADALKELQ